MNIMSQHEQTLNSMQPTKIAVLDLLRHCNAKCKICYYRWTTFDAPKGKAEYWSKSLDQAKHEVIDALNRGCTGADVTGGEPTIYPYMVELAEFCNERNFNLRIITNGQANEEMMYRLIGAGVKDWLFSVHDIEEMLDDLMQKPGAWEQIQKNIKLVQERGCKIATNTVIFNGNYNRLDKIAKWIAENIGPYTHNFINVNPRYEDSFEKEEEKC